MTRRSRLATSKRWSHELQSFDGRSGWPPGGLPAGAQLALLRPGAVLYNPANWWHEVASFDGRPEAATGRRGAAGATAASVSFRFYEHKDKHSPVVDGESGREFAAEHCEFVVRGGARHLCCWVLVWG